MYLFKLANQYYMQIKRMNKFFVVTLDLSYVKENTNNKLLHS